MNTRYDVCIKMRSGNWHYGNILGDYSLNKILKMCDYSVVNMASGTNRNLFYNDFTNTFYGSNNIIFEKDSEKYDVFLDKNFGFFCESVLCVPKIHWREIANISKTEISKKYMLAYISSPDKYKRKAVQFYRGRLEMDCMNIVDGNYTENKKILNLKNTLPEMTFPDFVKYFINSYFVITDNYYALCLAVVLNKPFIYFGDDDKTAEFLTNIGLNERVVFDTENFPTNNRLLQPVDFSVANRFISEKSREMLGFIKNMENLKPFTENPTDKAVTSTLDLNLCVGCSACVNVCPKGALSLKPDKYGYYCTSIDKERCINCGLCSKTCPVLKQPEKNPEMPDCYSFITSDEEILMQSSSGGVFSLLADEVFKRGGVVAGGAWRDDFTVEHIIIDKKEDMPKLRKSKYLQSYLGDTYKKIKEYLNNGRFVLFSGCGCQAAGLRNYLKKDYENLLIVDIFCHYSPSPMFFRKYTENCFDNLKRYEFRYKNGDNCWDCFTVKVDDNNNESVRHGSAEDEYQRVFHSELMLSEHCANCKFQSRQRFGDISLGDFWGIKSHEADIPYGKGVSCVFVNNDKGRKFFESIPESKIKWKKKEPVEWVGGNGFVYEGKNKFSRKNKDFYKAIRFMPFEEAANYALKPDRGIKNVVMGSNPLQFDSKAVHFRFDKNVWEESFSDNVTYLKVKPGQTKTGNYAVLPLGNMLDKNKTYRISARFRFKSDSKVLYFHIKDSGSKTVRVIAVHRAEKNTGMNWIELEQTFQPASNIFDEFMFGASQVKGNGAFIAIDYIHITEKEN